MLKVFGWIILVASLVIIGTAWIGESILDIIFSLSIGLNGLYDGIDLIKKSNN